MKLFGTLVEGFSVTSHEGEVAQRGFEMEQRDVPHTCQDFYEPTSANLSLSRLQLLDDRNAVTNL